jgi:hypothetical protein
LWLRVDSAGYQQQVIEAAERHGTDYSVTAKRNKPVAAVIHALATDPDTVWARRWGMRPAGAAKSPRPPPRCWGAVCG